MPICQTRRNSTTSSFFEEVAPKYDFVTKALSLGRDAAWKRQLVRLCLKEMGTPRCVDLACGTGDVSLLLADRYPEGNDNRHRFDRIDVGTGQTATDSGEISPSHNAICVTPVLKVARLISSQAAMHCEMLLTLSRRSSKSNES